MVRMSSGTAHELGVTPTLPAGYNHGTTRAYPHCRPACAECRAANTAAAAERREARLAAGMPDDAHGKASGYTFWNCRCRRCKKAWRSSSADQKRRTRVKPTLADIPAVEHGTPRGHRYWGCKCANCAAVGSVLRAELVARRRASPEGPSSIRRYRYRIHPEPAAQAALRRVFGSCRFVYNSYIALARTRFEVGGKHPSGFEAAKTLVTGARKADATRWLSEVAHSVLSASVHDAADAYTRFFDSAAGRIAGRRVSPGSSRVALLDRPRAIRRTHSQSAEAGRTPEEAVGDCTWRTSTRTFE